MLAAGTTVGPYKILAPLGVGGMGEVYRAEDPKHHRQVAIKVLSPEVAATVGSERFLREIEIAAKLTHPHILPAHDSRTAEGPLFYVMPYVTGESLRDCLNREKRLPLEDALRLARGGPPTGDRDAGRREGRARWR
jgi:serine/threonine-protein kinase